MQVLLKDCLKVDCQPWHELSSVTYSSITCAIPESAAPLVAAQAVHSKSVVP